MSRSHHTDLESADFGFFFLWSLSSVLDLGCLSCSFIPSPELNMLNRKINPIAFFCSYKGKIASNGKKKETMFFYIWKVNIASPEDGKGIQDRK